MAGVAVRIIGNACAIPGPHPDLLSEGITTTGLQIQVSGIGIGPDLNAEATEDK